MKRLSSLFFLMALTAMPCCFGETLLKLPPMPKPPVIDGKIGEDEWRGGSQQFGAISRSNGILAKRVVYFYFGYDEKNLYFAHRSELPPEPMKVGAKEDCFLTVQPPGATKPFVFRMRERKAPEGKIPGHWESEIAIPLKELNLAFIEYGKPWKLQMSRQWSDPDEVADWAGKASAIFIPQKDIPATGLLGFWTYGEKPYRGQSCNFRWQAVLTEQEVNFVAEVSSLEVPRTFARRFQLKSGKSEVLDWRQLLTTGVDYSLRYDITLPVSGEKLQSRIIPWNSNQGKMWIDPDPPVRLEVGIYPTFKKGKARLNCASKAKMNGLKDVLISIVSEDGKKTFYEGRPQMPGATLEFQLPELPLGGYFLKAAYTDGKGKQEEQSSFFAIRKFPWQGLRIGAERLIVPPFKPLVVKDGSEVQSLQTAIRLGSGGIAEINALGKNLLSAPALLRIDGEVLAFSGAKTIEESKDRVVMEATGERKNLSVTAMYEFDYDGMLKITWKFVPKGFLLLKNMAFELPLHQEYGKLLHVVGDGMRRNIHQSLSDRQGILWDSLHTGRKIQYPGGFHPYIWLGNSLRGLAWFAETTHNWETGSRKPAQEILRNGESVILRINLSGANGIFRDQPFSIITGLQPSPVKPILPEGFCHSNFSWEGWAPEKSEPFYIFGNYFVPFFSEDPPLTPPNGDFSHLHYLFARTWKNRAESDTEIKEYIRRNHLPVLYRGKVFSFNDVVETRMQQGVIRAEKAKYRLLYSDPRALVSTWPEYDMYADEWNRAEWRSGRPSTLYGADPDENYMDFLLYYWTIVLKKGLSDGVYFDNVYDAVIPDPVIAQGRLRTNISPKTPYYPIFLWRELIRRTAVLLTQQGKMLHGRPALHLHITDVNVLPINSLASGFTDWEMNFGSWLYSQRFPEAYILTNSTGVQAGLMPQLIAQVAQGLDDTQRETINNSLLAVSFAYNLLDHEYGGRPGDHYKKIQNLIRAFGYGDAKTTEVFPGWHPDNPVKSSLTTVKVTAVKRKDGHWLLMIGNIDKRVSKVKIMLPGTFVLTDAESGEKLGQDNSIELPVEGNSYRLVELQ